MDNAISFRFQANSKEGVKISFNDMVVKAVALSLKENPNVNSAWMGDFIRRNEHVNVGVAVAVEDGLLVPVVRYADTKSMDQISAEVKEFALKAKNKKITYKEVLKSIKKRDKSDKNRKISPLKKTKDMYLINSSSESISTCFMKIKKIIDRKINN